MAETVLVGCYTQGLPHAPDAAGPGILTLSVTEQNVSEISRCGVDICGPNPSYLASNEGGDIFAVNEVENGSLTRMKLESDGSLRLVVRVTCGGFPCHVAIVSNGVVATCFGDGSLWSYESVEGKIKVVDVMFPSKFYEDKTNGTALHHVLPLGEDLMMICDPVAEVVSLVSRDEKGMLGFVSSVHLPGHYPRHAVQHHGQVYVCCAKSRCIIELLRDEYDELYLFKRVSVGDGEGALGAIRVARDRVIVSERGNGCDRIWTVDMRDGACIGYTGSQGLVPRDVNVDCNLVVVANQGSGTISVGSIDELMATGKHLRVFDVGGQHTSPASTLFVGSSCCSSYKQRTNEDDPLPAT